jgi:hypothetical protein
MLVVDDRGTGGWALKIRGAAAAKLRLNMTRAPTGFFVCNVVALSRLIHPITDFHVALFRLGTVLA